MRFAWWGNIILLSVLTLVLAGPVWGDGVPETGPAPVTDYGVFLGELQTGGALQFYDNTEEILRLAQFERALMRYRFLKGQIQRRGDYRGLLAMVDYRLRFLKKQLHLQERDIAAIPARKARIPKAKPPQAKDTPKKDAVAKPSTPGTAANKNNAKAGPSLPGQLPAVMTPRLPQKTGAPPVTAIPPATGVPNVTTTPPVTAAPGATPAPPVTAAPPVPGAQKPPDVVTSDTQAKEGKSEEEKEKEETKPAPPLSFWEKMKIRLHLKKKAAEPGKAAESGS